MILTYYASVKGGVNNLAVAFDTETGESSSSLISKENAHKALKRKNSQNNKNFGGFHHGK